MTADMLEQLSQNARKVLRHGNRHEASVVNSKTPCIIMVRVDRT
jgi:hypothetical protein